MTAEYSITECHQQVIDCIKAGKNEEAKEILKSNSIDFIGNLEKSFLHWLVELGNGKMVQYLIDSGLEIDEQDNQGNTALMVAIEANKEYMMEILIEAGANIYISNKKGKCPIETIFNEWTLPNRELVKLLLNRLRDECGEDTQLLVNKLMDYRCPIYFIVLLRDAKITAMMLDRGCCITARCPRIHDTALHEAVRQSDLANVKLLIERGASVRYMGYQNETPLCRYNVWIKDTYEKLEILKLLIAKGAPLYCPKKQPPIERLYEEGQKETVCTLLRIKGIDLRKRFRNYRTALHLICINKNPGMAEAIKLFQGKDFDIDAVDYDDSWWLAAVKKTALMIAADRRCKSVVEVLLEIGANPNVCDENKTSMLFRMCRNHCKWVQESRENDGPIVELLLQYGIDVLYKDKDDSHILDHAIGRYFHIGKSILARLAQLEVLGEFGILNTMHLDMALREGFSEHYIPYLKYLDQMKTFKIYQSMSLLDLLIESERKLKRIVRNENFMLECNRVMMEKQDVIPQYYFTAIQRRLFTAVKNAELEEQAAGVICKIVGLADEHIVAYKIVDYLKLKDLMNLIEIN